MVKAVVFFSNVTEIAHKSCVVACQIHNSNKFQNIRIGVE